MKTPRCLLALALAASAAPALAQCPPTFTDAPDLILPTAFALALGDVNGDGRLDIVAGRNAAGGGISVYIGAGGGAFADPAASGTIPEVRHLILADLNGDGNPDAIASTNSTVEVFMNLDNGTLAAPVSYVVGALCRQAAAADIDNDGDLDVLVASGTPGGSLELFRNNGAGGLVRTSLPVPQPANAVHLEDFTNDGWTDVVIGAASSLGVFTMTNDGAGNLLPAQQILSNVGGNAFAAGDLNGDGQRELILMQPNMARVNILANQGFGSYAPLSLSTTSTGLQWLPAIADLTGDGIAELILPFNNRVNIYQQSNPLVFMLPTTHNTGTNASQVVVGDLNEDGLPDLVVANTTTGTIRPLLTTPSVTITQHPTPQSTSYGGAASFTIAATTTGPTLTYQWRRGGVALAEGGHYTGVNTPTLSVTEATTLEAGPYDCLITSCGTLATTPALLTVSGCPDADFNHDGDIGTDADIEAFFRVLGGGGC